MPAKSRINWYRCYERVVRTKVVYQLCIIADVETETPRMNSVSEKIDIISVLFKKLYRNFEIYILY